ncbi:MAG: orotidine-5'-phosphate decarboxylase [Candidatus Nanopelagicales bacterium]
MAKAPIAVALDGPDLQTIVGWAEAVAPHVSTLKVGLETYLRDGEAAIQAVRSTGCDLFLDLKLHDIPNTVAGAARSVARFTPQYLTVHALGGAAMVSAAAAALPGTRITAVTVLTSMDEPALRSIGIQDSALDAAVRLAVLAVTAGARAIVCSPLEVAAIRAVVPADIVLITPGVRPLGAEVGDQKRIATPQQAIAQGADIVVIGRPITAAADPARAAAAIAWEL